MHPNLIIDAFPEKVQFAGADCPIRTDFRIGMLFEGLIREREIEKDARIEQVLRLYYPPESLRHIEQTGAINEAVTGVLWFYACGDPPKPEKSSARTGSIRRRLYDWDEDAPMIYAAFYAQCGIDLNRAQGLHGWALCALLSARSQWAKHLK